MNEGKMKLYSPCVNVMNVAGFMSGTGSVLREIIKKEDGYKVVLIFSDNIKSNAVKIGKEFDIPVLIRDLESYCNKRKVTVFNMTARKRFDKEISKVLKLYNVYTIACAGYMRLLTSVLLSNYLCVNVHPADLRILDDNGKRKYIGTHSVKDAIYGGQNELRSTTHIMNNEVDGGQILMVSDPLEIPAEKPIVDKEICKLQNALKKKGDFVIFPQTLTNIANGRYVLDITNNKVHLED